MPSLLWDSLPPYLTNNKDVGSEKVPVGGILVYDACLLRALLKYGTFESYYYFGHSAQELPPGLVEYGERLQRIDLCNVDTLSGVKDMVLFRSGTDLSAYLPLRQRIRKSWPICGLTHGLSDTVDISRYILQCLLRLEPWDSVICSTPNAQQTLLGIYEGLEKSECIRVPLSRPNIAFPIVPLGIELAQPICKEKARQSLGLAQTDFYFLFVGRMSPINKSDLRVVISAFLSLEDLRQNSRLVIAGDDTDLHCANDLRSFAATYGRPSRVEIIPNITNSVKQKLLSACDCFISLSDTYSETFGISVLEAMAVGLPVIVSDWSGYRSLVDHGVEGLRVPTIGPATRGRASSLSMLMDLRYFEAQQIAFDHRIFKDNLRAVYESPDLAARLGRNGRAKVEAIYAWDRIVPRMEAVWKWQLQEAAKQKETSEVPESPFFYDQGRAFAAYSSQHVRSNTELRLGSPDQILKCLRQRGSIFWNIPSNMIPSLGDSLFQKIAARGTVTLESLHGDFADTDQELLTAHVLRLLKYGFLEARV